MDTFGVTAHGVSRELAFAANPKYKESQQQACHQHGCAERWLDPDLLRADGQPLGSYWRWSLQHQADVRRPTGPHDRFRFPVTTAMDIGWSLVDPALNGAHFLCNERRSPLTQSDVFRVWHEQMLHTGEDLSLRTRKPLDLAELTPKLRCVELPESSSFLMGLDKQAWMQAREDQLLEGVLKLAPGHNTVEPIGAAERLRQLEMQRREERQKKRSQMEGSRILREQMETMRFRKDMQPPAHALPKQVEESEPPTWRPPIIIPVTRTHVLPGQVLLHGTKKVLFSELLPHQKESESGPQILVPMPKQISGQRMLAMQRVQYPLGSHITKQHARGMLKSEVPPQPLAEQHLSARPKEEFRVLPLVRGVPIHKPGDARCDAIRDTSMQEYQDSSLGAGHRLNPTPKQRLSMQRHEIKKHAKMHLKNTFIQEAKTNTTRKQQTKAITFDSKSKGTKRSRFS